MTEVTFTPKLEVVGSFRGLATVEEVAAERGMFSCSPAFVEEHAGPLALSIFHQLPQSFFDEAEELGLYPNIDVRVHRLYPGDYPAVPGWHCDGELRPTWHAQPQLDKVPEHRHLVGTISTDEAGVSLTEFVTTPLTLQVEEGQEGVWEQVHHQVEEAPCERLLAQDGSLYDFSSFTLHRTTPARVRGWRLFLRASMWHKPWLSGGGELARQEYVYRLDEAKGW